MIRGNNGEIALDRIVQDASKKSIDPPPLDWRNKQLVERLRRQDVKYLSSPFFAHDVRRAHDLGLLAPILTSVGYPAFSQAIIQGFQRLISRLV